MTIQLTIKLFGTLSLGVPDYDHEKGVVIDAPDGITPEGLLTDLQIIPSHVGLISYKNRAIQQDTHLSDGMVISFFSPISGG